MFLQSLVFGYGGVRFSPRGISLDPQLPPGVTAMKLRGLSSAGAEFDVTVTASGGGGRKGSSVTAVKIAKCNRGGAEQETAHVVVKEGGVIWLE